MSYTSLPKFGPLGGVFYEFLPPHWAASRAMQRSTSLPGKGPVALLHGSAAQSVFRSAWVNGQGVNCSPVTRKQERVMNKTLVTLGIIAAAALPAAAFARPVVAVGVDIGVPAYVPPPVVYQPAAVYAPPAVVYPAYEYGPTVVYPGYYGYHGYYGHYGYRGYYGPHYYYHR